MGPWCVRSSLVLAATVLTTVAHAQPKPHSDELARLTGMAEFGIGDMMLPAATVCTDRAAGKCKQGDTSLMLDAWQLLRPSRRFAAGAGVTLGLFPTRDVPPNDAPSVSRDHKRSYFVAEAILRGYFYSSPEWEFWGGATGGLVVVADTYSSKEALTGRVMQGPSGVTTRTEGPTLGCAVGASRPIVGDWSLGASLRYGLWLLPSQAGRTPFGDEASLAGRNSMLLLGLSVGYKLDLY
jgi:hypothetical protein